MSRSLHQMLGFFVLVILLGACNTAKDPKEVSAAFINDLYSLRFDEAATLTTPATKALIQKGQQQVAEKGLGSDEAAKRTTETAEALFSTNKFTVKTTGEDATVQNDVVIIPLKKEGGEWKVAATEELVETVLFRQLYLESAKTAWHNLKEAYDKRQTLAQEYLLSRSSGTMTAETKQLASALKTVIDKGEMNGTEKADFVAKQSQLSTLLEKNIQPSFTAGSDLSLNYIIQLGTAKDAIMNATQAYNEAVSKARSKEFPPIK